MHFGAHKPTKQAQNRLEVPVFRLLSWDPEGEQSACFPRDKLCRNGKVFCRPDAKVFGQTTDFVLPPYAYLTPGLLTEKFE